PDAELVLAVHAGGAHDHGQLSVWIILATCVRVSEFTTALREHVRADQHTIKRLGAGLWHIPASKTGPAMDIPLAPPVIEWFRELDALALDSRYIVPARSVARLKKGGGDASVGKDAVWGAIDYWFEYS
ncbi:integrase, partial [Xylella fastidiosa subsp. multiplex]|nr:integrase [Xylella fastidiosa subsp. multiplex]